MNPHLQDFEFQRLRLMEYSQSADISIEQKVLKLQEEVGELSSSLLSVLKAKNRSASANPDFQEEAVDVLINILDIIGEDFSSDRFMDLLSMKLDKFSWKINNNA